MKKKTLTILAALLAIAQGAWAQTVVNDEAALNYAIAGAEGETISIRLGADITLSAYLKIGESKEQTVVLDLYGHKLRRNLGAVDANGHVIEVFGKGELTVKDTSKGGEISGGRANNGGGICNYGTLHLEGGTITSCLADNTGGGVRNNGTMTMDGGVILGCWGSDCGGIYNAEGATLTITGGVISGNTSGRGGGGIVNYGMADISGGAIHNNHATTRGGGIWNGGELTIGAATIEGNRADIEGGGIFYRANCNYYHPSGIVHLLGEATIRNNTSADGGGIYVQDGDRAAWVQIIGATITGNTSTAHGGGGVTNHGTVFISGTTITGNRCHTNGGGVWSGGSLAIEGDVTITGNESTYGMSNLYLTEGKVVAFTGPLTDNSSIGVSMETSGVFTGGYGTNNTKVSHFFPDGCYEIAVNTDGEGYLSLNKRKYYECSWDEKNKRVVHTVKEIPSYRLVDNICSEKYANGGDLKGNTYWFIVDGEATIDKRLYCREGTVHIILCDNARLTLQKGIESDYFVGTLYIYCQSYGSSMGKLIVTNPNTHDAGIGCGMNKDVGHIIIHGGDITVKGGSGAAGIGGGFGSEGTGFEIYGGKVESNGGEDGAGIGGGELGHGGKTIIYGGDVKASGGGNGAGIGSGSFSDGSPIDSGGSTIIIVGGRVEAHGGELGAGIGGGELSYGGTITIGGGEVYAYGGTNAAGIGSGEEDTFNNIDGGTITISGGRVEAHGGELGAGIGGGQDADGGTITISGGEVYAYGGNDAAGIGSGEELSVSGNSNGGTITISGGYVYAEGDDVAAGIGAGEDADMGNITITGGIVEAYGGGGEDWANAIASNDDNENVNSLTIGPNMKVTAGSKLSPILQPNTMVDPINISMKDLAPRQYRFARIEPCDHPDCGGYPIIDGARHRIDGCRYCLMVSEAHTFGGDSKCVCGLLGLREDADNTTVFNQWSNTTQTVTLRGGTFHQDLSSWSALCLPFDISSENTSFDGDVQLKTFEKATFDIHTGTLRLHFADAEFVEAGRPCFVNWISLPSANSAFVPFFTNVTIKSLAPQDDSPSNIVKFCGTYAPITLKAGTPTLYLDSEDHLRLPDSDTTVGAFHAWFQTNTSTLGDVNGDDVSSVVDVTMLVDHILGREDAGFVVGNSDVNGDEMVSVADVTELVDIILHGGNNLNNVVVIGAGDLTLSTTTLRLAFETTEKVEVTYGSGSYEVECSDLDVASTSIDGTTITVTAIGEGEATITVTDTKSGQTAKIKVSVSYIACPDDNHPHLIDLGLPSCTKWSCCNEGASKPEEFGERYPFGAVSSAPTIEQILEMTQHCKDTLTIMNGVPGVQFTGKNGGKIFLPLAGNVLDDILQDVNSVGHYWSSSLWKYNKDYAYFLSIDSNGVYYGRTLRGNLLSVRPVR